VLDFLSAPWFARFSEELAQVGPDPGAPPLALGQVVTGTAHGTVCYTVLMDATGVKLLVGSTEQAAVTLVEDWETARAIVAGTPVAELLAAGRITLRGDANALLAGQVRLVTLGRSLAALQRETRTETEGQKGP